MHQFLKINAGNSLGDEGLGKVSHLKSHSLIKECLYSRDIPALRHPCTETSLHSDIPALRHTCAEASLF